MSTALIYVDDTAWDRSTVEALAGRLAKRARSGTIVIHNAAEDGAQEAYEGGRFRRLAALAVGTSWNLGHTVYVEEVV